VAGFPRVLGYSREKNPTGLGDVTKTHIKWQISQVPSRIGFPIIIGDLVYRLHAPNILKCWCVADGDRAPSDSINSPAPGPAPSSTATGVRISAQPVELTIPGLFD
jgi:outer membrane protein assembly factor BamB